ncbi:MAG: hypothetical protein ACFCU6_04660 [Balneolaceae bacterium]
MIQTIAIGLALGLMAIGVVGMIFGGVRNVTSGKSEIKKVSMMAVPFVVFAISYAITGAFDRAGVATMIVMMAIMIVSIALTGMRGTFKF